MKRYEYVGPRELLDLIPKPSTRQLIQNAADILSWLNRTYQKIPSEIVVTFIIDTMGNLWIADRHSEHVVCALGGPVLSAGEMTFQVAVSQIEVVAISNQSTGFCPEAESWPRVASALNQINITHPQNFTDIFHFRHCKECDSINLVKEGWLVCDVCDSDLEPTWNLDRDVTGK